jgi:hypothetical protein
MRWGLRYLHRPWMFGWPPVEYLLAFVRLQRCIHVFLDIVFHYIELRLEVNEETPEVSLSLHSSWIRNR